MKIQFAFEVRVCFFLSPALNPLKQATKIRNNFYLDSFNTTKLLTKWSDVKLFFVKNFLNQISTINFKFNCLGVK